jgi:hypothetical protein
MAQAQFPNGGFPTPNYPGYPANVTIPFGYRYSHGWNPYGPFGWQGFGGGGTAASANAQALASLIRAQGEYEVQNAQALRMNTELRNEERQRRMAQRQAYFQMQNARAEAARERNLARRERRDGHLSRQSSDQLARVLGPEEFDPATGVLRWPSVLQRNEFQGTRTLIDQQLKNWATSKGEKGSFDFDSVDREIASLRDQLKEIVSQTSLQEYFDGRLFIDRLDSSLRMPSKSS